MGLGDHSPDPLPLSPGPGPGRGPRGRPGPRLRARPAFRPWGQPRRWTPGQGAARLAPRLPAILRRPAHRRRGRWPRLRLVLAVLVLVVLAPVGFSLGRALSAPGTTGLGVRSVEWLRDHGASRAVVAVENLWYSHHRPPVGGRPQPGLIPSPAVPTHPVIASGSRPAGPHPSGPSPLGPPVPAQLPAGDQASVLRALPAPAPIVPIASPPLAGEGTWHPLGRQVGGSPAMYAAFLRPDPVHTSLVTGVAWMDTRLLGARLFAGSDVPGGSGWSDTAPIPDGLRTTLDAAFNSGFRLQDSLGGYFAQGRTVQPLVEGAASLVIGDDGTLSVGQWGRDVTSTAGLAAVRQNLSLIVDQGRPVANLATDDFHRWGATLGNNVLVWRSGVGVTATGAIVYAGGPGLSIQSLADVLVRAGARRAMELDINTQWVSFYSFAPAPGAPASPGNGSKLLAEMDEPTSRYFQLSSRDFVAMFAR